MLDYSRKLDFIACVIVCCLGSNYGLLEVSTPSDTCCIYIYVHLDRSAREMLWQFSSSIDKLTSTILSDSGVENQNRTRREMCN